MTKTQRPPSAPACSEGRVTFSEKIRRKRHAGERSRRGFGALERTAAVISLCPSHPFDVVSSSSISPCSVTRARIEKGKLTLISACGWVAIWGSQECTSFATRLARDSLLLACRSLRLQSSPGAHQGQSDSKGCQLLAQEGRGPNLASRLPWRSPTRQVLRRRLGRRSRLRLRRHLAPNQRVSRLSATHSHYGGKSSCCAHCRRTWPRAEDGVAEVGLASLQGLELVLEGPHCGPAAQVHA